MSTDTPLTTALIKTINEHRTENGMTLADIEQATGTPKATLSRIFNGKGCHSETLLKIAQAVGLSVHLGKPKPASRR